MSALCLLKWSCGRSIFQYCIPSGTPVSFGRCPAKTPGHIDFRLTPPTTRLGAAALLLVRKCSRATLTTTHPAGFQMPRYIIPPDPPVRPFSLSFIWCPTSRFALSSLLLLYFSLRRGELDECRYRRLRTGGNLAIDGSSSQNQTVFSPARPH